MGPEINGFLRTLLLGLLVPGTYLLARRLGAKVRRYRFAKARGCGSPKRYHELNKLPFGISFRREILRAIKQQRVPQWFDDTFHDVATTWEVSDIFGRTLSTCDPRIVKALLGPSQFQDFGVQPGRHSSSYPFLGDSIFNSDGPVWEHSRALLRPQFAKTQINDFIAHERHVDRLLKAMYRGGATESEFLEIFGLLSRFSLDSTTEFALGTSTDTLLDPDTGLGKKTGKEMNLASAITIIEEGLQTRGDYGNFLARFFMDYKQFYKAIALTHRVVDDFIDTTIARQEVSEKSGSSVDDSGRYVLLHELIKDSKDKKFTRSQAISILHAGRDSISGLLAWTIRILARRRDIFTKLRSEVVSALGEGEAARCPTYQEIRDLKYLDWVLKEVLRLYPLVPLNDRNVLRDTTIPTGGGPDGAQPVFVKEGESVIFSVFTIQRSKDAYGEDADEFVPERWSENAPRDLKDIGWWYLPFNKGPRICPGQSYALNLASYALVRILQQTKLFTMKEEEIKEMNKDPLDRNFRNDLHLAMGRDDGLRIKFWKTE